MGDRKLPTEPGWWWRMAGDTPFAVRVRHDNYQRGAFVFFDGQRVNGSPVLDDGQWLAPVAPFGSVPPEVYARDVLGPFAHTRQDVARTLTAAGLSTADAERIVREVTP